MGLKSALDYEKQFNETVGELEEEVELLKERLAAPIKETTINSLKGKFFNDCVAQRMDMEGRVGKPNMLTWVNKTPDEVWDWIEKEIIRLQKERNGFNN